MGTLKPQSNGPYYTAVVIGTLAVDGWAGYIWYSEERPGPLIAVPNVTTHPLTASVPKFFQSRIVWLTFSVYKLN